MRLFFLLFSFALCLAQEVLELDYRQAYELALKNNRELQRLKYQIQALNIDYELAKKYYLPVVSVGASIIYDADKKEWIREANISLSSLIYEFQRTSLRIDISRLRRDMAQLLLEQLKRDLQLRILRLFSEAELYRKLTEVKREEMAVAFVRFDRARERKELGLATDHEVFRLESIYRERRSELLQAQYMLNKTLLEIKKLTGLPLESLITLKELPKKDFDIKEEDLKGLMEMALKNNANLKIKDLELKSYEDEIRVAKEPFSMRVGLKLSTYRSSLELSTPVIDTTRPYRVDRLMALKQQAITEREDLEQSIKLVFLSAPYEWEYLKARLTETATKDRYAEENLTLRRSEYELELAFDLGYAMSEKSEAERQLIKARHDLLLFLAQLYNLAGLEPFKVLE
jgi:outer membrane protein TolC